jgi:hypothetical protein
MAAGRQAIGDEERQLAGPGQGSRPAGRPAPGPPASPNAGRRVPRGADGAIGTVADEVQDFVHGRVLGEFLGHVLDPLGQRAFVREEEPVGAAQVVDLLARETRAAAGR